MRKLGFLLIPALAATLLLLAQPSANAAGRVQLEIVGNTRGASLTFQKWVRALGKAGVRNVKIRTATSADKLGIDTRGTASSPLYVVTAALNARDEVVVPGAKFKRSEAARLARWIDDLAKNGPPQQREPIGPFDMTQRQFDKIKSDLSTPVDFTTTDVPRSKVASRIIQRLALPLKLEQRHIELMEKDTVVEDLLGISSGTALACVLRPAGLCLVPYASETGMGYSVVDAKPKLEIWPIGWKPNKPLRKTLPGLFEFLGVNIQGVSAQDALVAIAKRLKVQVLMDHNALARHGVEPSKVVVSLPKSRSTYGIMLRKILFQAALKYELRVDESGKPLLWISTVKPM
jgi:hypothetical protein